MLIIANDIEFLKYFQLSDSWCWRSFVKIRGLQHQYVKKLASYLMAVAHPFLAVNVEMSQTQN